MYMLVDITCTCISMSEIEDIADMESAPANARPRAVIQWAVGQGDPSGVTCVIHLYSNS